jgi:uncharacterized repeat protein (TIGR03803 family)
MKTQAASRLLNALLLLLSFTVSANAAETILYDFSGGSDGDAPGGGLIHGPDGSFFGTAAGGGANGLGVVYQFLPPSQPGGAWTETVLYSFQGGNDGYQPYSGLVRDSAGNLYGVTYYGGGIDNFGVVYEVSPNSTTGVWTEKVIYAFQGPEVGDGFAPNGTLYLSSNGALFGTTVYGGSGDFGTVYELSPPLHANGAWKEKVLYSFTGGNDGGEPFAGLVRGTNVRGANGVFYGTTALGGTHSLGTVFSLTEASGNWTETVLHSFAGGDHDGNGPESPLYLDAKGNLFGTTPVGIGNTCSGGDSGCGMVFALSPNHSGGWTEIILYTFQGGEDGSQPTGALISNGSGTFWGTTLSGGGAYCDNTEGYGCGTVYELTNTNGVWTETVLYAFPGGSGGEAPQAGVVRLNGDLYGTTNSGGSAESGTIFEIN